MLNSLRSDRRIPKIPPHPVLLSEPEREVGDQELRRKTKEKLFFVNPASVLPESILLSFLIILDTGLRRYDESTVKAIVTLHQITSIRF